MEKIEYFLGKTLNLKHTAVYDIVIELSSELIDAFKNHLYQLVMSSFSVWLFAHQFYHKQLAYLEIDDSFLKFIFPTFVGSILYNILSNGDSANGRNRIVIFLCSIPLPAFTLEYLLTFMGLEPNAAFYFIGGLFGYPILMLVITIFDYVKKESPNLLKKISDIFISALSNRFGAKKEDENL